MRTRGSYQARHDFADSVVPGDEHIAQRFAELRVEAGGIAIEGVSIAGHESYYKLPGFRTMLEFGRAPEDTLGYGIVCLSHGHLDHAAGLAHHASRRKLTGLPPARVFAPEEALDDLAAWLAVSAWRRFRTARGSSRPRRAAPSRCAATSS